MSSIPRQTKAGISTPQSSQTRDANSTISTQHLLDNESSEDVTHHTITSMVYSSKLNQLRAELAAAERALAAECAEQCSP
ncbi:hypothetical protein KIN20_008926 [Parelaphostrongylus tenuis]|uniref:Uncharacterized protein n=1 Tax=Parelaphostrongylus tenuis TaxID=148309 RepID=A0AAD5M5H5_PARTN|nr:hypothetical protein KIN20_008926 [Parelaphostrongylus tenuis]